MAEVRVRETFKIDGVLANMTSVSFDGVLVSPVATGVYEYLFTDKTAGTSFSYTLVYVYEGVTSSETKTAYVPLSGVYGVAGEGVITKAEILTDVNANTLFAETDIDRSIIAILLDISTRGGFLKTSATGTWPVGSGDLTLPADFVALDAFEYNDEEVDEGTMGEMIDESQFLYAIRGNKLYLTPTPTAAYAYTIYYAQTHPASADAIYFGEAFRECINAGVTAKRFEAKQQFDSANYYRNLYEQKLSGLIDKIPYQPILTRIRKNFRE